MCACFAYHPILIYVSFSLLCACLCLCGRMQALLSPTTVVEVAITLPLNDTGDGLNSFYFYEVRRQTDTLGCILLWATGCASATANRSPTSPPRTPKRTKYMVH